MAKRIPSKLTWYAPAVVTSPTHVMQALLAAVITLDNRFGGQSVGANPRRVAIFDVVTPDYPERVLPPSRSSLCALDVLALRQVKPVRVVKDEVTYVGDVIDFLIHTARELSPTKHVMSSSDVSRSLSLLRFGDTKPTKVFRIGVFAVRNEDNDGQSYFLDYAI